MDSAGRPDLLHVWLLHVDLECNRWRICAYAKLLDLHFELSNSSHFQPISHIKSDANLHNIIIYIDTTHPL